MKFNLEEILDKNWFTLTSEIKGEINFENHIIGSYELKGKELEIIFDVEEEVNQRLGKGGFIELNFNINAEIDDKEVIKIINFGKEKEKTYILKRNNIVGNPINKTGKNVNGDNKTISWEIDINTDLEKLGNVTIQDKISDELTLKSLNIYELNESYVDGAVVYTKGHFIKNIQPKDYNGEINLENVNYKAYRVEIETEVNRKKSEYDDLTINNEAILQIGEREYRDSDSVQLKGNKVFSKTGYTDDRNQLIWNIEFMYDGNNTIIDTLTYPKNVKIENFNIYEIENVDLDNDLRDIVEELETLSDSEEMKSTKYKIDLTKISDKLTVGQKYKLSYINSVTFLDGLQGAYKFKNKANYGSNETSEVITTINRKIASKESGSVYKENGKTYVDWKVTLNKNNENWTHFKVTEMLPEGFIIEDGTEISYKIGDIEDKIIINGNKNNEFLLMDTFEIPEEQRGKEIVINIKTLLERIPENQEENFKNKIKVEWKIVGNTDWIGMVGGSREGSNGVDYVEGTLDMTKVKESISKKVINVNYENKGKGNITWRVDYNIFDRSIKGLKIVDKLLQNELEIGHEYDKNSFEVIVNGVVNKLIEGKNRITVKSENEELSELEYLLEFNESKTKFELSLLDGQILDNKRNIVEVNYQTKFDLSKSKDVEPKTKNSEKAIEFFVENEVIADNPESEEILKGNDKVEILNSSNGDKSGNILKDRIFNWTANLNYKYKTIQKGSVIEDIIVMDEVNFGNHEYIKDSLKIYIGEISKNGEELIKQDIFDNYDIKFDNEKNKFTIILGEDINHPIIIEYETEGKDISKPYYRNKIKFNGQEYFSDIRYEKYNKFIEKKLNEEGNIYKGDILNWEVTINESLSEIRNLTFKDTMSKALSLITDSIIIEDLDGNVVDEAEYRILKVVELDTSEKQLEIKFNEDKISNKGYVIKYQTEVVEDGIVSNKALVEGEKFIIELDKAIEKNVVSFSNSGFWAGDKPKRGEAFLTIEKTGQDKILLPNAEFKLEKKMYSTGTYEEVGVLTTDDTGKINIKLTKGKYRLTEVKAPEGYMREDKVYFLDVINSNESETDNFIKVELGEKQTIKIENKKSVEGLELNIIKKDYSSKVNLSGVEFNLYSLDENNEKVALVKSNLKTDGNGKININDLAEGKYELEEIKSLPNYQSLKEKLIFNVTSEGKIELENKSDMYEIANENKAYDLTVYNKKNEPGKPVEPKDPVEEPGNGGENPSVPDIIEKPKDPKEDPVVEPKEEPKDPIEGPKEELTEEELLALAEEEAKRKREEELLALAEEEARKQEEQRRKEELAKANKLPKTGSKDNIGYVVAGISLIGIGAALGLKKKDK